MIAEDMQPFFIIENRGFQKLVQLLDSRYTLPSRRTIERTLIPNIYETTRAKVFELVSIAKHVAITSDV
jgi:zinc finger BED domain-containing protein 1 (E3 SUMO-protein ligase ZBED1)